MDPDESRVWFVARRHDRACQRNTQQTANNLFTKSLLPQLTMLGFHDTALP